MSKTFLYGPVGTIVGRWSLRERSGHKHRNNGAGRRVHHSRAKTVGETANASGHGRKGIRVSTNNNTRSCKRPRSRKTRLPSVRAPHQGSRHCASEKTMAQRAAPPTPHSCCLVTPRTVRRGGSLQKRTARKRMARKPRAAHTGTPREPPWPPLPPGPHAHPPPRADAKAPHVPRRRRAVLGLLHWQPQHVVGHVWAEELARRQPLLEGREHPNQARWRL